MVLQQIGREILGWKPSGSAEAGIREDEDSTSFLDAAIIIEATIFDFLVAIQKPADDAAEELAFQSAYAKFVEQVDPYPTEESLDLLRWRLQICHCSGQGEGSANLEYSEYFQNYLAYLRLISHNESQEDLTHSAFHDIKEGFEKFRLARLLFSNLCVFIISSGYAGLGPPKLAQDDRICLFHGAVTPFIIRPNPRVEGEELTYTLVGDCYVHGIMYGEGMKKGTAEDIRLR